MHQTWAGTMGHGSFRLQTPTIVIIGHPYNWQAPCFQNSARTARMATGTFLWDGLISSCRGDVRPNPASADFPNGGYSLLRNENMFALFNLPRYRFRPSQADALHVDLWCDGVNVLRDGGTYSYSEDEEMFDYFGGTNSHNTVQFDDRDQMPRLSRFLFGAWLKATEVVPLSKNGNGMTAAAGYRDYKGACHHRTIRLTDRKLSVIDKISDFDRKAVLRWRLQPGSWQVDENRVTNGKQVVEVKSTAALVRFEVVEGWESRYYMQKTPIPVLELEVDQECTLTTEFRIDT